MDTGGEHPGERAGGGRHVIVACHATLCFDSGAAQQNWYYH